MKPIVRLIRSMFLILEAFALLIMLLIVLGFLGFLAAVALFCLGLIVYGLFSMLSLAVGQVLAAAVTTIITVYALASCQNQTTA